MGYRLGNPYTLALLVTGLFSLSVAVFVTRYRSKRGVWPLAAILVGAGVWAVSDALRIAAPTASAVLLWNTVSYAGVALIAPGTLLFAAAYADRDAWFRPTRTVPLVGISVLAFLMALANPNGLWRASESVSPGTPPPVLIEQFGAVHVLWVVYVVGFVVPVSFGMVIRARRREAVSRLVNRQTSVILLAYTVPLVCSLLYVTGLVPVDPTPFGFFVTGVAFSVAVLRYRLLDLVPVARATVLESIDSGVLVLDADGTVVDANATALSILQLDESTVVGTSLRAVTERLPVETDRFLDVRETEESVTVDTGGDTRHYDVRVSPITSLGADLGRIVIFSDVTERVERREELAARTAALERQNERLDEFASLVSHDLRNPLNVAVGSVDLARATEDLSELDRADAAFERMEDLIDDLLVLSRTGNGIEDTEPVPVEPVARATWSHLDTDDATLAVRDDAPTVDADRTQVRHVFENLFKNAVEHASTTPDSQVRQDTGSASASEPSVADDPEDPVEHGTASHEIRLPEDAPEQDSPDLEPETVEYRGGGPDDSGVTVTVGALEDSPGFFVADDGPGIPPDEREDVFEHGYTTDSDGTGFGLSIVDHVTEAHGWDLELTESCDGGARFEFRT